MSKGTVITLIVIIVVLVGVVLLWSSGPSTEPTGTGSTAVTKDSVTGNVALPELTLTDYNGDAVALQSLVGQPLVVNAWASWCPFCVNELPDFAVIQEEFAGKVQFVAIDRAESLSTAKGFTDELGLSDSYLFLLDEGDSFYQAIGGFSMPETLFVAADGSVQFHKRGPMDLNEIRQRTSDLITASN